MKLSQTAYSAGFCCNWNRINGAYSFVGRPALYSGLVPGESIVLAGSNPVQNCRTLVMIKHLYLQRQPGIFPSVAITIEK